jgi:hypothetical protein
MNVADVFAAVVLSGLGFGRLWETLQAWRQPPGATPNLPRDILLTPFGDRAARGAARAVAAQAVILLAAGCLMATLAIASAVPGPAAAVLRAAGGIVGVTGVLFGVITGMMIILFNRPRFLVPPPFRREASVLGR